MKYERLESSTKEKWRMYTKKAKSLGRSSKIGLFILRCCSCGRNAQGPAGLTLNSFEVAFNLKPIDPFSS